MDLKCTVVPVTVVGVIVFKQYSLSRPHSTCCHSVSTHTTGNQYAALTATGNHRQHSLLQATIGSTHCYRQPVGHNFISDQVGWLSDASNEDWGFRITAHAPISQKIANELSVANSIPLKAVQIALQAEGNNAERAEAGLKAGTYSSEESVTSEAESNITRGVYQDPDGALQVNLQTAEVYIRGRQRIPVPTSISTHTDFKAVIEAGGRNPEGMHTLQL